jgi:hypothetical protein
LLLKKAASVRHQRQDAKLLGGVRKLQVEDCSVIGGPLILTFKSPKLKRLLEGGPATNGPPYVPI